MNETESKHLQELLTTFDARALGEGDEMVGLNLLAVKAVTLANLAHPGSAILTPNIRHILVGCNLLASGARLTSMILDEVVTPVGCCQENLLANLARLLKSDEEQNLRPQRSLQRQWNFFKGPASSRGENSLFELMTADPMNDPTCETADKKWLDVLSSSPSVHFANLVRRPRFFIAAASPVMLNRQLGGVHSGQALMTIALNSASDAGRFGVLCPALMGGMIPVGPSGESVKGRLLVTDSGGVLPEVAREANDKHAWLGRLLWLVEGNAGPEPPPQQTGDANTGCLPNVSARFVYAAQLILANRMNSREPGSEFDEMDFTENQVRWMEFLQNMESRLPGISGTARHLLASLVFGLRRIVAAGEIPKGFKYYLDGIEALARFLIRRMASARAAIHFSAVEARKLRIKQNILNKLSEDCLDSRSIYHPLHIPAATCHATLLEMEAENLVKRRGKEWERIKGATFPEN